MLALRSTPLGTSDRPMPITKDSSSAVMTPKTGGISTSKYDLRVPASSLPTLEAKDLVIMCGKTLTHTT